MWKIILGVLLVLAGLVVGYLGALWGLLSIFASSENDFKYFIGGVLMVIAGVVSIVWGIVERARKKKRRR